MLKHEEFTDILWGVVNHVAFLFLPNGHNCWIADVFTKTDGSSIIIHYKHMSQGSRKCFATGIMLTFVANERCKRRENYAITGTKFNKKENYKNLIHVVGKNQIKDKKYLVKY